MSEHLATVRWQRDGADFLAGRYSREHTWTFDGGVTVQASPSPAVIPEPYANPAHVDPEEAFVAAIASCHMLTYLHLASKQGFQIDAYSDPAVGTMTLNTQGVYWVSDVTLRPTINYSGDTTPSPREAQALHHQAHEQCFIANSVKTRITVA